MPKKIQSDLIKIHNKVFEGALLKFKEVFSSIGLSIGFAVFFLGWNKIDVLRQASHRAQWAMTTRQKRSVASESA